MSDNNKEQKSPPEIGPYVFPTLLAIFGLWCFYDGWFTSNPEMRLFSLSRINTGLSENNL